MKMENCIECEIQLKRNQFRVCDGQCGKRYCFGCAEKLCHCDSCKEEFCEECIVEMESPLVCKGCFEEV